MSASETVNKNTADEDTTYGSDISMNLTSKNLQFMFTGTRQLNFNCKIGEILKSNLILGLGINKLYPQNEFTEVLSFETSVYDKNFTFYTSRQLYGAKWSNHLSLSLMVKYELAFTSRLNGKNLFNLNLAYHQSFSNFNILSIEAKSTDLKIGIETKSLGSGFRIGISKKLEFQQKIKSS